MALRRSQQEGLVTSIQETNHIVETRRPTVKAPMSELSIWKTSLFHRGAWLRICIGSRWVHVACGGYRICP